MIGAELSDGRVFYHYPDEVWETFVCPAVDVPPYGFDGGNTETSIERLSGVGKLYEK